MFNFHSLNGDVGFVTKYVNTKLPNTHISVRTKIAEAAIKCSRDQTYTCYDIIDMLADASAWYPMDQYHCYTDTAGTTLASINSSVALIKNARPNTYTASVDAIQSTAGKRATLKSDGLEFIRSVDGGYNVDFTWLAGETDYVISVVHARLNYTTSNGLWTLFGGGDNTTNGNLAFYYNSAGRLYASHYNNTLISSNTIAYTSRQFSIVYENLYAGFPYRGWTLNETLLASTTATTGNPSALGLTTNNNSMIGNTLSTQLRTGASNGNNLGVAFEGVISDIWMWIGSSSVFSNWTELMMGRFFNYYRNLGITAYTI